MPGHRMVLALGWANGEIQHINKASQMWAELGFATLTSTITAQETFLNRERTGLRRRAAALVASAERAGASSIVPHMFSNGGVAMFLTMLEEMHAGRAPMLPVDGAVYDSAPSRWVHPVVILPVLAAAPPKTWGDTAAVLAGALPEVLAQCRPGTNDMTWFNQGVRDPAVNRADHPELFLHSSGDRLVGVREVETFSQLRADQGVAITRYNFGASSPHVQHMRTSPELYLHALRTWVDEHSLGPAAAADDGEERERESESRFVA